MDLVKKDSHFLYSGFQLNEVGISPVGSPSFEEWEELGRFIKRAKKSVQFWLGDWINYGEARWGEKYSQALTVTDYEQGTLQNFAYVARNVDFSLRNEELSYGHHVLVANLEPQEQKEWLEDAVINNWSVREMRDTMHPAELQEGQISCPRCGFHFTPSHTIT